MNILENVADPLAEELIIAECLLKESIEPLGDLLPDQFSNSTYRVCCEALRSLARSGKPIHSIQIDEWRKANKKNGFDLTTLLVSNTAHELVKPDQLPYYRDRIIDLARKRGAIKESAKLAEEMGDAVSVEEIHERAAKIAEATGKASSAKGGKKAPPAASMYPSLPDDAWYGQGTAYREAVKESTEASDTFHFGCWMSAAGAIIGRTIYYKSPDEIFPNLFVLLVGRSGGARKGSAMGLSAKLIRDVKPNMRPVRSMDSAQGLIRKMHGAVPGGGLDDRMPPATILRLSEFKTLVVRAARKGTGDIFGFLCEAYDAPEYLENNVSKESASCHNGLLVMQAGAQESVIEHIDKDDLVEGIGNRITYWPGEKKKRKAHTPDPDPQIWNPLVANLKEIEEYWHKRGQTRIHMTQEASDTWTRYYESLDDMLKEDILIQILRERQHTNALKFALIHCGLDRSDFITNAHLKAAIAAAEYQHRAILALFSTFGASQWVKDEQKILEIVKDAGMEGIRSREVQRKFPRMSGEHFQRHLRWICVEDGPLRKLPVGKMEYLIWNE